MSLYEGDGSYERYQQVVQQRRVGIAFMDALVMAGDPDLWMEWHDLSERVLAAANARVHGTEPHGDGQEPTNGPDR